MHMSTVFSLRGAHLHPVCCATVISEQLLLASGDEGGCLVVWSLETRKVSDQRQLQVQILSLSHFVDPQTGRCLLFVQHRNGLILAFGVLDGKLTDAPLHRIECAEYSYCRAVLNINGLMMVPCGENLDGVCAIDCVTREVVIDDFSTAGKHGNVMCVAVHAEQLVAVGFEDGHVMLYRMQPAGSAVLVFDVKALDECVMCMSFERRDRIVVGGPGSHIVALDPVQGGAVKSGAFRKGGVSAIAELEGLVVTGGGDATVRVFDEALRCVHAFEDDIYSNLMDLKVAVLARPIPGRGFMKRIDRCLVTCSKDHLINVWQIL